VAKAKLISKSEYDHQIQHVSFSNGTRHTFVVPEKLVFKHALTGFNCFANTASSTTIRTQNRSNSVKFSHPD
jgi:hypothetical protein